MMKASIPLVLIACLSFSFGAARADLILFDFNSAPAHSPLPIDLTVGGLTAHFSATGQGYSIQPADTMGFTPAGFGGNCIYPSSVFASDLMISFSQPLSDISLLYAPQELATDSSCTMRIRAYSGTTYVGTNTYSIPTPGTWPTGTLSFGSAMTFDNVKVHYESPPPTGGDYGWIFMADNVQATTVPEPGIGSLAAIASGFGAMLGFCGRRKSGK